MSYGKEFNSRLGSRIRFESLEGRSMLSGNPLSHGIASGPLVSDHSAIVGAAISGSSQSSNTGRGGPGSSRGNDRVEQETHLAATLTDPTGLTTLNATVQFESESEHGVLKTSLEVQVHGATPGASLAVALGTGEPLGVIVVNAQGEGRLDLSSNPTKPGQLPLPANLPVIGVSTTVVVGPLNGTLANALNADDHRGGRGNDGPGHH